MPRPGRTGRLMVRAVLMSVSIAMVAAACGGAPSIPGQAAAGGEAVAAAPPTTSELATASDTTAAIATTADAFLEPAGQPSLTPRPAPRATPSTLGEALELVEREGLFSGVIAVRQGDEITSRGYGSADREADVANDVETVFDIGSVTKQFTGAAIVRLQMDGLLSVDDPIAEHLPGPSRTTRPTSRSTSCSPTLRASPMRWAATTTRSAARTIWTRPLRRHCSSNREPPSTIQTPATACSASSSSG